MSKIDPMYRQDMAHIKTAKREEMIALQAKLKKRAPKRRVYRELLKDVTRWLEAN